MMCTITPQLGSTIYLGSTNNQELWIIVPLSFGDPILQGYKGKGLSRSTTQSNNEVAFYPRLSTIIPNQMIYRICNVVILKVDDTKRIWGREPKPSQSSLSNVAWCSSMALSLPLSFTILQNITSKWHPRTYIYT